MIKIQCTKCSKLLKLPFDEVPKIPVKVKCPNCGNVKILKGSEKKTTGIIESSSTNDSALQEDQKVHITCPHCNANFFIRQNKLPDRDFKIRCRKCNNSFLYKKIDIQHPRSGLSHEAVRSIMWDLLEDDEKKEFKKISDNLQKKRLQTDVKKILETEDKDFDNLNKEFEQHTEKSNLENILEIPEEEQEKKEEKVHSEDFFEESISHPTIDESQKISMETEQESSNDSVKPDLQKATQKSKVIQLPIKEKRGLQGIYNTQQTLMQQEMEESREESEPEPEDPSTETKTEKPAPPVKKISINYRWSILGVALLAILYVSVFRTDLVRAYLTQPIIHLFSGYMEHADYKKAEMLYKQENYELAKNAVDRALENDPNNKDYRSLKIACQLWLNPGLLKDINAEGNYSIRGLKDLLIHSEDMQIKAKVIDAMSRLGNPVVVPLLIKTFDTDIPIDLKRKIIEALGNLKDPSCIETLSKALNSDDTSIRFAICTAFGEIGSSKGAYHLKTALRDSDFTVRYKAAEALQKINGEISSKILAEALDDPELENKENVLIALGKIGDKNAVPSIGKIFKENLSNSGDLLLRHAATVALGEVGGSEAFGILKEAIMIPETPDKQDIVAALGKMDSEGVIDCLINIITDKHSFSRTVKREAAYSLLEKGDPETIPILKSAVKDGLIDKSDLEITLRKNSP